MRRRRLLPLCSELRRVEALLGRYPACEQRLRPRTVQVRTRTGRAFRFSLFVVAVTNTLRERRINPERTGKLNILAAASEIVSAQEAAD